MKKFLQICYLNNSICISDIESPDSKETESKRNKRVVFKKISKINTSALNTQNLIGDKF